MKNNSTRLSRNLYQVQKAFALGYIVSYHLAFSKASMHQ